MSAQNTDLFERPHVEKLQNGQYHVKSGNLTLIQTIINGSRFNECSEVKTDYSELCSQHDERFNPLFIALHNFKSNEQAMF